MLSLISRDNKFTKNALTLITGTSLGQLIPILLQPVLRRLYLPEDFGAFAVYINIVGILVVISTLRYELAIVLPKSNRIAINVVVLSFFISISLNIIFFICILMFKDSFGKSLNLSERYSDWLLFVPLATFLLSNFYIVNYWYIRQKAFKISAIAKLIRRGAEGVTHLGFGLIKQPFGLVIGDILGNISNNIIGIILLRKNGFNLTFVKKQRILFVIKKYKEFPLFNTIPHLLSTISFSLPVLYANMLFTEEITGFFDLSRLLLLVPIALIADVLSQVIYQDTIEKKNSQHNISNYLLKIFKIIVLSSIVGGSIVYFLGEFLIQFFFGAKWFLSGEILKILVFSFSIKFIVSPFNLIFAALEKIKIISMWQFFYFVSIFSLYFLKHEDFFEFLRLYVFIDIAFYLVLLILVWNTITSYEKQIQNKTA